MSGNEGREGDAKWYATKPRPPDLNSRHPNTMKVNGILFVVLKALKNDVWEIQQKQFHRPCRERCPLEPLSTKEMVPIKTVDSVFGGLSRATRTLLLLLISAGKLHDSSPLYFATVAKILCRVLDKNNLKQIKNN